LNEQPALLFIPDISGFTKFVNDTEIQHSQHIIEELLEVILESNELKLSVSEIEGDAVLFYRFGDAPTPQDIGAQTQKTFLNFHTYLRQIERDTVCRCGACRTTSNLTLKLIVHFGEIGLSQIREHQKLVGKNVILAHRLMKNDVPGDEYLLMSTDYTDQFKGDELTEGFNWGDLQGGHTEYEHIGKVDYKFVELTVLRDKLSPVGVGTDAKKYPNPIKATNYINAPMSVIYNIVTNLALRTEWTEGLKKIVYDKNEIPRLGSRHVCELPIGKVELETVQNSFLEGRIEYADRMIKNRIFPEGTSFFIMEDAGPGTNFSLEFHYKRLFLIGWFIDKVLRPKLLAGFEKSIQNLKAYCEKQ
jgi:hypothetical protein